MIINKNNKNYLILYDGEFVAKDRSEINKFSFKKTEIDLSTYSTKTTTFPKIQELTTAKLFDCIYSFQSGKIFVDRVLQCNKNTIKNIIQEFLKRIYMPTYIPLIALLCVLQIIKTKNNRNYSRYKFTLFLYICSIIIFSEISLRYSAINLIFSISFLSIPIILFLLNYFYLLNELKVKER